MLFISGAKPSSCSALFTLPSRRRGPLFDDFFAIDYIQSAVLVASSASVPGNQLQHTADRIEGEIYRPFVPSSNSASFLLEIGNDERRRRIILSFKFAIIVLGTLGRAPSPAQINLDRVCLGIVPHNSGQNAACNVALFTRRYQTLLVIVHEEIPRMDLRHTVPTVSRRMTARGSGSDRTGNIHAQFRFQSFLKSNNCITLKNRVLHHTFGSIGVVAVPSVRVNHEKVGVRRVDNQLAQREGIFGQRVDAITPIAAAKIEQLQAQQTTILFCHATREKD